MYRLIALFIVTYRCWPNRHHAHHGLKAVRLEQNKIRFERLERFFTPTWIVKFLLSEIRDVDITMLCILGWLPIIQGEHKFFSWLQTFITRQLYVVPQLEDFQPWIIFQQRCCNSTLGFTCSSVFGCNISKQVDWERLSDTLATTIAGYHPPLLPFMAVF